MPTVTYGAEYTFNAAITSLGLSCAALDATHFVVCYRDSGGDTFGHAKIGVVSGDPLDDIAYGSEYTFNAAITTLGSCTALDATHFVVCYKDVGGDTFSHAKIGVVSGDPLDDIAYGLEYTFNAAVAADIFCAALDSTHFVVCYRDQGDLNKGKARIGVVSGDEIAYGAVYTFNAVFSDHIFCAALDPTHFVVCYRDQGGDDHGIARIGVVSGDEIAFGDEYTFNAADSRWISCAALDATHFVVCYNDYGDDTLGHAKIGVVSSGDQIAYGAEYTYSTGIAYYNSCAALGSTPFVVCYRDAGVDDYGIARIGVVSSGDQIAYGDAYTYNAATSDWNSARPLDSTHFVVCYQDTGGDGHGIARIGVLAALGPANVAEVNGVPAANIAKVNSVAWADIAKVNEVG